MPSQPAVSASGALALLYVCAALMPCRVCAQRIPASIPDLDIGLAGEITAIARQNDGRLIIGGAFSEVNGVARDNLARLNANGSLDTTWNPGVGGLLSKVDDLAIDLDEGFVYVVGSFSTIGGEERSNVARVQLGGAGTADPSWPGDEVSLSPSSVAVGIEDVYLDDSPSFEGEPPRLVIRLAKVSKAPGGSADPIWGVTLSSDGILNVHDLEMIEPHLYVAGTFNSANGDERSNLARFEALGAGDLDPIWAPNPDGNFIPTVNAIATDENFLYVGGDFGMIGGEARRGLARIELDGEGRSDPAWRTSVVSREVLSLGVSPERTALYVGGRFEALEDVAAGTLQRSGLAKLNLRDDGAVEAAWRFPLNFGPTTMTETFARAILATDLGIFVGGTFTRLDAATAGAADTALLKLDPATGRRDRVIPTEIHSPGEVNAIVVQEDNKIVVGGNIAFVDGIRRRHLFRINPDGRLDRSWDPAPGGPVSELVISGTDLFVAGRFDSVGGVDIAALAKLGTGSSDRADPRWAPLANFQSPRIDALAAGEGFVFVGLRRGLDEGTLLKFEAFGGGQRDFAWNPDPQSEFGIPARIEAIEVVGNSVYAAGDIATIQGEPRTGVAKIPVEGDGLADPAWNPFITGVFGEPASDFNDLEADGPHLYISGQFGAVDGNDQADNVVRVGLDDGALDDGWLPQGIRPDKLSVGAASVYVAGFALVSDPGPGVTPVSGLVRIDKLTGRIDINYQFENDLVAVSGRVTPIARPEGLLFGGRFSRFGGVPRQSLALLAEPEPPLVTPVTPLGPFIISRTPTDGQDVTHFAILNLRGGRLFLANGVTPVADGGFITVAQGLAGLVFRPAPGSPPVREFTVSSAVDDSPAGLGCADTTVEVGSGASTTTFQLSATSFSVCESGQVQVLVEKTGDAPGSVDISFEPFTAEAFSGVSGDYSAFPGSLSFAAGESSKQSTIFIFDDGELEGDETFTVRLGSPSAGTVLASPASAVVTIIDNEFFGTLGSVLDIVPPAPPAPPPAGATLTCTLTPTAAGGQWRLPGDPSWRDSGTSASGLASGNYSVEFREVDGFVAPLDQRVPVVSGQMEAVAASYTAVAAGAPGDLSVEILPESLALAAEVDARGQWRRQGEVIWRDSGDTISALPAGTHIVEFKVVAGRATPASVNVQVVSAQTNLLTATYYIGESSTGTPIAPLALASATDSDPFRFCGQLRTPVGFASGSVVKTNVVLTVAHAVFDDATLSYVRSADWFFQRYRDQFEPAATAPRGWYSPAGYAAQRTADASPGISSAESQNLDQAALYFLNQNDAGRGGASGFLSAAAGASNEWLTTNLDRILAGYPVSDVSAADVGKLFASTQSSQAFSHSHGAVFSTSAVRAFPGTSGGPLFCRHSNGNFYPAAVYLGGTGDTRVRAIDDATVDLLNRAENSGRGGGQSTGGGSAITSPGQTQDSFATGFLTARANLSSARWRIRDTPVGGGAAANTSLIQFQPLLAPVTLPPGTWVVEFEERPGFVKPGDRTADVVPSQTAIVDGTYTQSYASWAALELTSIGVTETDPLDDFDCDGIVHLFEFAFGLSPSLPGGHAGLPVVSVESGRLTLTYRRRHGDTAPGLSYDAEFSGAPSAGWTQNSTNETVIPIDEMWEQVSVQDAVAGSPADRFGRVRVTLE